MQVIQTVTVGSGGAATVAFTSIPQDATDLVIKTSLRNTADNAGGTIAFNTGGTYTRRRLLTNASAVSSDTATVDYQSNTSASTSSTFSNGEIYIPNYTGSTTKSYSVFSANENNGTPASMSIIAGLWNQTAAITSITLTPGSGNFAEGSVVSLYKIKKA
jgi:hypothetical protein